MLKIMSVQNEQKNKQNRLVINISKFFQFLRFNLISLRLQCQFLSAFIQIIIIKRNFIPLKSNNCQHKQSMDAKAYLVTQQQSEGVYIAQFKTNDLAIYSYYVESQNQSYLIDPTFDFYVFRQFIKNRGSQLKYVILTHYHADFLAGHTQFGVPILMGQKSKRSINSFEIIQIQDGKSFNVGNVATKVLHTPGHTLQSSCFLLSNSNSEQICLFSGDTVFLGQVGRSDLSVSSAVTKEDLAGMLYDSIQKIKLLDKTLRLYPGHGAGSTCGKTIGNGNFCNLQNQHLNNYGFSVNGRQQFIKAVTQGIQEPPSYFYYDAKLNQLGPPKNYQIALKTSKTKLSIQQFSQAYNQRTYIIDVRENVDNGIIKNSYWLHRKGPISHWIAMLLSPQDQFLLVCQQGTEQDIIQRFLRIGYFGCKGFNSFDINQCTLEKSFPATKKFDKLPQNRTFLDVRTKEQSEKTGVIQGATIIDLKYLQKSDEALQILKRRTQNLHIKNIVVHCRTGLRARLAVSILLRKNITNAIVLLQDISNFSNLGLNLIKLQDNQIILRERLAKDFFYQGMKSFNSGNVKDSSAKFQKCVEHNPKIAYPQINLAICSLKTGNPGEAIRQLHNAIQIDPFNYITYFNLFSIKYKEHKYQDALGHLYAILSCLYLDKAKQSKSIYDIQKALQYAPNNFQALVLNSLNLKQADKNQEAFESLLKSFQFCPTNKTVKNLLVKFCESLSIKLPQANNNQFFGLNGKIFSGTNLRLQIDQKVKQLNKIYLHGHKALNKDKSFVVDFQRTFQGVSRIYKVRR